MQRTIGTTLGIVLVLVAIWNFDIGDSDRLFVSALLFIGGVLTLLADTRSASLRKMHDWLLYLGIAVLIFYTLKLIF